jgi:nucleoid DNA-binding protein
MFKKGEYMNELVNLVVEKTGIPAATAQTIVKMIVDFLKQKLPAPVAGQIDGLMSDETKVKQAEGFFAKIASFFGKK